MSTTLKYPRFAPLIATLTLVGFGCSGPKVPEPAYGPALVAADQWLEVENPPPAVRIAEPGLPPSPGYVWIDGQWAFQTASNRWVWEPGEWCILPPHFAYYSKPVVARFRKVIGRVDRWNDSTKNYEEVDEGDDMYRWVAGQFWVRDDQGKIVADSSNQEVCVPGRGIGTADK